VARNKAMIVFPASIRWARRAVFFFPGLSDRVLLRLMRQSRQYRTTEAVAAEPGTTSG
jgi:hypothetical protein